MKCTLVISEGNDRWVRLLDGSERVFFDYDGSDGWEEATVSWAAMSKHMHLIKEIREETEIPKDLAMHLKLVQPK